ncbi:unnamed protein product [Closterium sp. Naga37s-1]|nr:unnamed protein product [Closterium sp. Naga37s-1]
MAEELAPLDETLSPTDDGFHAHALGGSVFSGSDAEAPELGSLNVSRGRAAERSSRGGGAGGAKRFGRGGMVMAVIMRLLAINKRILIPVALASLASMLMGYDIGVTSGAVLIVQRTYHLSIADKELFIGSFSFAAAISALLSGPLADSFGRRPLLLLSSLLSSIGFLTMALSHTFPTLLFTRILTGFGVGIGLTVGPLYCVELAPADSRGSLSALSELLSSLGLLLGYLISFLLSPSPKELVHPNEAVKQMLMLAVGAAFYQQATGVPTMLYYTPELFATMGLTSSAAILSASLAVALARTLASLVPLSILDEIGRRTLLLISTAGMTIALLAQAIVLHTMNLGGEFDISSENPSSSSPLTPLVSRPFQSNAAALSVIAAANLTVFFAIGLSPISTLLPPEIFPLRLRAQGTGLAVAVSRLVAAALSSSFLSLVDATSPGFPFFVFAVLSAAAVPFLHSCMRETRGVKLEGASALFEPSLGGGVGRGGGVWGGGGVGGAAGAGEEGAVMDGHGRAIGRRARNVGGGDRASTS